MGFLVYIESFLKFVLVLVLDDSMLRKSTFLDEVGSCKTNLNNFYLRFIKLNW